MDQNDKNNKNRRGNRNSNLLGAGKLVAWALALTLVFYCTSSYMGTSGRQASNINIEYSDFVAMTEEKQVADVSVDSSEGLLYITPKDGYVYTDQNGVAYTKSTDTDGNAVYTYTDSAGKQQTASLKLFTGKMETNDTLVERMHEAGIQDYDVKYEPQMSPLLVFAINFILPFAFIMLMFSLVMRISSRPHPQTQTKPYFTFTAILSRLYSLTPKWFSMSTRLSPAISTMGCPGIGSAARSAPSASRSQIYRRFPTFPAPPFGKAYEWRAADLHRFFRGEAT